VGPRFRLGRAATGPAGACPRHPRPPGDGAGHGQVRRMFRHSVWRAAGWPSFAVISRSHRDLSRPGPAESRRRDENPYSRCPDVCAPQ